MSRKNQMQIPHDLQLFFQPTALICLNHDRAKVFQIDKNMITDLGLFHTPDTDYAYSDKESFDHHGSGAFDILFKPGTDHHNKEHYLHVFFNYFSERLKELDQTYRFHEIYLFSPADIKNLVREKIPISLREKAHLIAGNLLHEHPLELLKRIENLQEKLSL